MGGLARVFSLSLLLAVAVCGAGACELVLAQAEYSSDRSRAVEFTGIPSICTVSGAGDVNGDGFEDFVIADSTATGVSFTLAGEVHVVFGRSAADWASASFDFSAANTPNTTSWIRIKGTANNMNLGEASIAHGDFNGDGLSDILISTDLSEVFCVYGHGGAWSSFDTSDLGMSGTPGFNINGGSIGEKRYAGNAGDMNGDGIEDIIISDEVAGMAYIVFGEAGTSRIAFDVITVDGTNGFAVDDGAISTGNCANLGSAGDVNGDGLADLVLGSKDALNGKGRAYVLFARNVSEVGQWSDSTKLSTDLDGANGFIVSSPASSNLGWVAVGAGDVNADGFADIFIGSGSTSGAWVVFGHPTPWTSLLDASLLNGTDGFHISGSAEMWGYSGGGVGDFNSDGIDDILISGYEAFDSNSVQTGAAAIIFGNGGAWPAELSRADFVGSVGFLVDGPSIGSYFGWSARGAGDVNGDGHADFLVAAPNDAFALLVFGVADDHCAVCSNSTNECLACEDRFYLDPAMMNCEACTGSNCRTCTSPIVCTACDDGFYLDTGACDSCAIISDCITCNSASDCTACVVGYFASGSGTCQACSVHCFACTSASNCTDCEDGFVLVNGFCEEVASSSSSSSASASYSAAVVVVIETGGGGSAIEVAAEIAQLLGVDVGQISVIEITPGTFEVTVINEEVAQQLVTLIEKCIEDGTASGDQQ